uniref:Periplasmic chaperone PpiD n=1 Tax=uncultured marine bacterium 439 TaxID=257389 RepID=Q6SHE5_9BACT|nr:peptidyl-prolyl cis-trans isomerase, putative [uncultured marine bacterium 439]
MLGAIRKKSKGWVAYLIVGLITVPFALFGIQEYMGGSSNSAVASVDGEDISLDYYYQKLNTQQRNLQQQLGASYSAEIDNALRQTLIDSLINEKLLENFTNSMKLVTLEEEVRSFIQSNPVFQVDGVFSEERYIQLLRLNGFTPLAYELEQSKSMSLDQIKRNLNNSAFLSTVQIDQLNDLSAQERDVSFLVLSTEKYKEQIIVDQDQISEYFDNNKSNFIEGHKVQVDFVELSLDNIEQQTNPDNETLRKLYVENEELYTNSEQRRAQHILLEEESNARAILKEIKEGGDFSELARIHSKDITTSEEGGDLGLFERELMVPEFDKAVFDMDVGDISEVVKTDYGYHIIKLNEIQPSTLQSFEEVEGQLLVLHKKNVNQEALYELQEELSNLSYEESIDVVSSQLDLELQTSDFFSEYSTEYDEVFVSTAFSDIVFKEGENSDVIELSKDRFIVMTLANQQPERQKVLDEVEDQIVDIVRNIGAKQLIDDLAQNISSSLTSGDDAQVKTLMVENDLEWNDVGWITRDSQLPFNATSKVYKLSKPNTGEHTYHSQSADANTTLVIDLKAVKLSDEVINSETIDLYLSEENNELFLSLVKKLRDSAEIKVFSDLL